MANAAWAFARTGRLDAPLFAAMARVAERLAGEFNAQDIANTVWALSAAERPDV